jgi:hypothetical protein
MGPDGLKKCPTCAKFVRHEVIKCPYCAADFPIDPTINLAKARRINNIVIVAILVISAIAVLVGLWR